jgi:hypothetical protein
MSIQATKQIGGEEPLEPALVELQEVVLGMFLVWDALGDGYEAREAVEKTILMDWARKHKVSKRTALEALIRTKLNFMENPWAHFVQCRDFKNEGWGSVLMMTPRGNAEVLEQISGLLEKRQFKETKSE